MADALTHHFYVGQRSKRSNVTWESLITLSVKRFSRNWFLNFVTTRQLFKQLLHGANRGASVRFDQSQFE
ncbi:hypothetical protein CRENBAI_002751 [Crenichthys baileyi]|uniref:Uncharacterized protein n=1 Tax=Crenichthys baileyi TaxID=28760 RepID=A0AAV9R1M4_9TELE